MWKPLLTVFSQLRDSRVVLQVSRCPDSSATAMASSSTEAAPARRVRCNVATGMASLLLVAVLLSSLPATCHSTPFSFTDWFAPNCTLPTLPLSPGILASGGESTGSNEPIFCTIYRFGCSDVSHVKYRFGCSDVSHVKYRFGCNHVCKMIHLYRMLFV